MRRRNFIQIMAGSAAGLPFAVRAQQSPKWRVGFLTLGADESPVVTGRITAFREGLRLGSVPETADTEIFERRASGQVDRLSTMAADLVAQGVQAICAIAPPAVHAARAATSSIPILALDLESDPVASGWAASLAHPGGNVTGIFLDIPGSAQKRCS